ncbi:MAG: holin family protein [Acidobacteria bacterium]|nr:holin family protein [Acidobacteriota bacterium]
MNPALIAPIFELGKGLIDRIFPDRVAQAEQRARAESELLMLQQQGRIQETAQQLSAIIAEAQSPDPWTSRARPSFLYVMYVMILVSIPFAVLWALYPEVGDRMATGLQKWLAAIPDAMWALFGAGYLGYTGARMWEKGKGAAK